MKKTFIFAACLLVTGGLSAQGKKSLVDIDKELRQSKSSTTIAALVENIAESTPETAEDVATLGQLMDKYPIQGQKALMRIKDPKLANAVMRECDRQAKRMAGIRLKKEFDLSGKDRAQYLNSYMNSTTAIVALGNIKSKVAIVFLRGYLDNEALSHAASVALGRLGDTASFERMIGDIENKKNIDLSGYGDKGLVRIIGEIDKPGIGRRRKFALIKQITGSSSHERKQMLKDLALNHKDAGVRDRSGLALLNSILVNPESGDVAFISEWVNRTKNDENGYWAVAALRTPYANTEKRPDSAVVALFLDVLKTSTYEPTRQEAAQALGTFRLKEVLPYLEECIRGDESDKIRGECQLAYWQISGAIPPIFTEEEARYFEKRLSEEYTRDFFSNLTDDNPVKQRHIAKVKALREYRRTHK